MSLSNPQPSVEFSIGNVNWSARIIQGDFCLFREGREYFSAPLNLKAAREMRELFALYIEGLEAAGVEK